MGQHTSIRTQLRALVPAADVRRQARLCGAVKRRRTIDIVEFLMATVVLVCGRDGQGIASMQAHLIAEELDIDPHTSRIEPGPPDPAYYNATLLADGAPPATARC